jgi:hypothetical protein
MTASTGTGSVNFSGGKGDDILFGGNSKDTLSGGDGDDSLSGGDGNDELYDGFGNDILSGDAGDDFLFADSGNDLLIGGDGNDALSGGEGNDSLYGGFGTDTIFLLGDKQDYKFSKNNDVYTIVSSIEGVDTLKSIEFIEFIKFMEQPIAIDSLLEKINHAPTGDVIISGEAQQGKTLSVSNTLADVDGLGKISYQWYSWGTTGTDAYADVPIGLPNSTTYTLTATDVGRYIVVKANYTDSNNNFESITSNFLSTYVTSPACESPANWKTNSNIQCWNGRFNLLHFKRCGLFSRI